MRKTMLSNRQYLKIALPFIFSTVTQPLLGAVDTAVVGRLGDPAYIGGVAVGAVIFNTMYWLFGFLRVSTTGFSAQAQGGNSQKEKTSSFFQPCSIALIISICFLLFQGIIFKTSMNFLRPEARVIEVTKTYYYILIWGAPFVLINYVVLGWLMGQSALKASLTMQITGNVVNILLDIIFVFYINLGVRGVAFATLFSQVLSTCIGFYFLKKHKIFQGFKWEFIFNKNKIISIMVVNINLMLRTACLLVQTNVFTATSAAFGTTILSANAILLQIQSVISYMFDGIANASSVYAGKAVGERSSELMKDTWKRTAQWAAILVVLISIVYLLTYESLIGIFTNLEIVSATAKSYGLWILIYPLIAAGGLTFYGVFTGAAVTKPVFQSTFFSLLVFLLVRRAAVNTYGNNGLWLSLLSFYCFRTVFLLPRLKETMKNTRSEQNETKDWSFRGERRRKATRFFTGGRDRNQHTGYSN
jgi:multidrug resistance protein, MATE family